MWFRCRVGAWLAVPSTTSSRTDIAPIVGLLHVLEARHVSFAKSYLAETWPTLDDEERQTDRGVVGGLAKLTTFLTELGVIDDVAPWVELGLVHPIRTSAPATL